MPIPGARFRVKQTSKGPVRLAFKGNKVVEAKKLKNRKAKHKAQIRAVRSYGGDNG